MNLLLSTAHRNENHSSSILKTPIFSISTNPTRNPTSHDVTKRIWIGFGWYYYRSRIRSGRPSRHEGLDPQDDEHEEVERSYFPAPWFYSRGFSFHSSCILGAWQYNLRPIRIIPKSAPVFEACRTGDLQKVMKLLEDREATIYDTDSDGYTPLHVSPSHHCLTVFYVTSSCPKERPTIFNLIANRLRHINCSLICVNSS